MALTFGGATSDRVNCGSGASLDDLSPFTWMAWIYPTAFTSGRRLAEKGSSTQKVMLLSGTSGDWRLQVARTVASNYITNDTPLALNTWKFVAATFDTGGGAGEIINLYTGGLNTIATESSYTSPADGSGAVTADASGDFVIGNVGVATFNQAFEGRIAFFGVWNRALSLGEIRAQQFRPHVTSGCVLFQYLGFAGTGTQPDYLGNANAGTVTGATVSDHVPIGPIWGRADGWAGAFTAAGAPPASGHTRRTLMGVG